MKKVTCSWCGQSKPQTRVNFRKRAGRWDPVCVHCRSEARGQSRREARARRVRESWGIWYHRWLCHQSTPGASAPPCANTLDELLEAQHGRCALSGIPFLLPIDEELHSMTYSGWLDSRENLSGIPELARVDPMRPEWENNCILVRRDLAGLMAHAGLAQVREMCGLVYRRPIEIPSADDLVEARIRLNGGSHGRTDA